MVNEHGEDFVWPRLSDQESENLLAAAARAKDDQALDFVDRINQGYFEGLEPLDTAQVDQLFAKIIERAPEHKVQPSLERVERALEYLGDPQNSYRSIHIAGTNGKTTTSRILDGLVTASGARSGRFTSPHLISPTERIAIAGRPISPAGFVAAYRDVEPIVDLVDQQNEVRLSFFELLTVMAYAAFADAPVDVAIIETGMGGRWDATNVITPEVSVITPISRDHERWLGTTISEIAAEKAGIIKAGVPVVIGKQEDEALDVLLQTAQSLDAPVRVYGRDFEVSSRRQAVGGQLISVTTQAARYEDIFLPLFGRHQSENAAAAIAAFELLNGGAALSGELVEEAMANVTSPGRLEFIRRSPAVLLDAAHNPAGAAALAHSIENELPFEHVSAVFSAMADKNIEATLAEVEPVVENLVLVEMAGERAADMATMEQIARSVFGPDRVHSASNLLDGIEKAVELAETASDDNLVGAATVIFGSVVLAGQALQLVADAKLK